MFRAPRAVKRRYPLDNPAAVINIFLNTNTRTDPDPFIGQTRNQPEADMKKRFAVIVLLAAVVVFPTGVWAHCEIPCGIYDDQARVQLIAEHIGTIEKSIQQIRELQKAEAVDYNQLVRWVMNKENHATEIQSIVAQYFMTQRIKPDSDQYAQKIAVLHRMLIAAMKCKQTTDLKYVAELRELLKTVDQLYFK